MKKNGNKKHFQFTLIELVIVIAILGTLAALIIPAFSNTEKEAKETSDLYNGRSVTRYVEMFQNANGYYPSGFHTGLTADGDSPMGLSEAFGVEEAEHHHDEEEEEEEHDHDEEGYTLEDDGPVEITELSDADNAKYISSLKAAGINYLTAGEVSEAVATPLKNTSVTINALKVKPNHETFEKKQFGGRTLASWVKPDQFEMGEHDANGIIVALFVTPNIDWEHVYSGGYHQHEDHGHFEVIENSRIALKNAPVSNVSKADFRYYCCFFKLYNDGSAAKLVGVVSPELSATE